jgi:hypothetical protein
MGAYFVIEGARETIDKLARAGIRARALPNGKLAIIPALDKLDHTAHALAAALA